MDYEKYYELLLSPETTHDRTLNWMLSLFLNTGRMSMGLNNHPMINIWFHCTKTNLLIQSNHIIISNGKFLQGLRRNSGIDCISRREKSCINYRKHPRLIC